jgi:hypothetical protein
MRFNGIVEANLKFIAGLLFSAVSFSTAATLAVIGR